MSGHYIQDELPMGLPPKVEPKTECVTAFEVLVYADGTVGVVADTTRLVERRATNPDIEWAAEKIAAGEKIRRTVEGVLAAIKNSNQDDVQDRLRASARRKGLI